MTELPSHARVVIVGGGIVGCSVAYHLALRGVTDVVLLERRAAHLRHHVARRRSRRPTARHPQPHPTGAVHHQPVRDAGGRDRSGDRVPGAWVGQRGAHRGALRGAEAWRLDGSGVRSRGRTSSPRPTCTTSSRSARVDDLVGGVYLPGDGVTNPIDTTQALGQGSPGPWRSDHRERQGRANPHRARAGRRCRHRRSARSAPTRSSTRPECGRTASVGRSAPSCRCTRPSTSTSSPTASMGSRPTCRCCAIRTAAATSRRKPAS